MTNEEFQRLVLSELGSLKEGQGELRQEVSDLKQDMSVLKQGQEELRQDVFGLKQDVSVLKQGQKELRQDVFALKQGQETVKGQLEETNQIVKALLHNQAHANARLTALEETTAKASALKELKATQEAMQDDIFYLVKKTVENGAGIKRLRAVE